MSNITLEKNNPVSTTILVNAESKDSLTLMLSSDLHYDSITCDLNLLEKHLKLAEEANAVVVVAGDLLDVMQGKNDPRRSMADLKKEYKVDSYFDAVIADTAKFLSRFNVPGLILADGNHELAALEHNGIDLLENIAYRLRVEYHKEAVHMGYWGYIPIVFKYKKGNASASKLLYFFHGESSHAVVTKGMINVNRQGVWLKSPDFILTGHNHYSWVAFEPTEEFDMWTKKPIRSGKIFFQSPGYHNSPTDMMRPQSWESQKQRAPKNKGCFFLTLQYSHGQGDVIESNYTSLIQ